MDYTSSTGATGFVAPDERPVYSLRNGNALNLISGEGWRSEDAVITNRRLYLNHKIGIINTQKTEQIIDIKDITGVMISRMNPVWVLIMSIIYMIAGIVVACLGFSNSPMFFIYGGLILIFGIVVLIIYAIVRKSYLSIEYAGGSIRFSVKGYSMNNIRTFQRIIFTIKDQFH